MKPLLPQLDPTLDVVFKSLLLRDSALVCDMINCVVRPGSPVASVVILNPELPGDYLDEKNVALDVFAECRNGDRFDLEMSGRNLPTDRDRFVLYGAKGLAGELDRGEGYEQLRPMHSILWCCQTLVPGTPFHSHYQLRERGCGATLSPLLGFHVLQLPLLPHALTLAVDATEAQVLRWGRFFTAKGRRERTRLAKEDPIMAQANQWLDRLSADQLERGRARDRELGQFAHRHAMATAKQQGLDQGLEQGLEQGEQAATLRLARRALARGDSVESVVDLTGLDLEVVRGLTR